MNDRDFKADIHTRLASEWASINPHLSQNDLHIESDTGKMKVGGGLRWQDTQYLPGVPVGEVGRSMSVFCLSNNRGQVK
jgi:hypothetical protein